MRRLGMRVFPLLLILLLAFEAQAQSTVSVVAYPEHMAGRKTASGKVYNPHGLTVAHPSLPFGTMLEISAGGNSVMVEVNDRGLMLGDGELILSAAAMNRLGLDLEEPGQASVRQWREGNRPRLASARNSGSTSRVVLTKDTATPATPPRSRPEPPKPPATVAQPASTQPAAVASTGMFAVQMGSFSDRASALKLAGTLDGAWIQSATVNGKPVHRVFFGHFRQRTEADGWQARLRGLGVDGYVRSVQN